MPLVSAASLRRVLLPCALALAAAAAFAQTPTERAVPDQGLREYTPRWHALTGVRIVTAPGRVIDNGTLVLKDGVVAAAGANLAVPAGAREWKLPGRTVYAGFIDLDSSVALPAPLRAPPPPRPMWGPLADLPTPPGQAPQPPRTPVVRSLASASAALRAEQDVAAQLEWKADGKGDDVRALRELGFGAALVVPQSGVFRGQSALVALGAAENAKQALLAPRVAQHAAFEYGKSGRDMAYPTALMGAIALARQTLLDARWYQAATAAPGGGERIEPNATLAALAPVVAGRQPLFWEAADEQSYARIAKLRDEFGVNVIARGNGLEYRRAAQIKALKLPVVVPLDYPAAPEAADPDAALDTPLAALQHWEQAASNLALLDKAGVRFAITTAGLENAARDFWPRLRQAVQRGLPAERALAALTTEPAALIGEGARLGTLEPGRLANVVVVRGDPFASDEAEIELSFVEGRPLLPQGPESAQRADPRGEWKVAGSSETLKIAGTRDAPRVEQGEAKCDLVGRGSQWVLRLPCTQPAQPDAATSVVVATAADDRLAGTVQAAAGPGAGTLVAWSAMRTAPAAAAAASAASAPAVPAPPGPAWPAGAFGIVLPERPAVVLVRGATIWTEGPQGVIDQGDLLIKDGRIAQVGSQIAPPAGALVIEAAGKHVTPGIIDAHSHIAIDGGVNEFSESVTAEVRVADVVDAADIEIYHQLAGGVTASNLLHGSANTIGGQNQVIKLRWGSDAEGLKFEGAQQGIKFALGENVKRSNWGPGGRYPATRMGVEQVLRDAFDAARAYQKERAAWRKGKGVEPRRDLRLEALAEILDRRRWVHIHSYVASEILMFARVAKDYGVPVAAFQHVLEGYKVADEIAKLGAGGSTFSDWWAYKMEVVDAIPYNGAIMQANGVNTSFNSDDAEQARHLYTEAAKAVKYGGMAPADALAFVTINPARQLGVETRVGSLEAGKDADFVIWSESPLSTYTRAEQTWIDGRRYFDLETDATLRAQAAAERSRLEAAVRAEKPAGPPRGRPGARGHDGAYAEHHVENCEDAQ